MTDGQAKALEQYWCACGIDFKPGLLDLAGIFHRNSPRVLDIGTGMGETLIQLAERHPENDYLAVEVHRPGVGSLIRHATDKKLKNIRVINHDVMEVLEFQLPGNSIDLVYLFFPDPWPKKRHHKRRLLNTDFLRLLSSKMKHNARLFIATDWEELADYMLKACDDCPELMNLAGRGNFSPRPVWRPLTKFEQRGQRLEHKVWDLCYCLK
jgi:tRNA (guanine-N7-)-methyltransferase